MINRESQEASRLRDLRRSAEERVFELDTAIGCQALWRPTTHEALGSIQSFLQSGEMTQGEAYASHGAIVVEQGSFVYVKGDARILSPDFSRCVGLLRRDEDGIFFAHSTEYETDILALLRQYGPTEGGVAFVPEDPPADLGIDLISLQKLKNLRRAFIESGVRVVSYPWSDFPPSHINADEGYLLMLSSTKNEAIRTKIVEDTSDVGYHHEVVNGVPTISI